MSYQQPKQLFTVWEDRKNRIIHIAERQNDGVTILPRRDNSVVINHDEISNQYFNG